jgi:Cupin
MAGSARMTVFNTGPHANTTDFKAGDVGLVRRNCGHYVENTGDDDLVFIETFRSDHYEEVSLANWLAHLPPKLVSAHLNIPGGHPRQVPPRRTGNRATAIAVRGRRRRAPPPPVFPLTRAGPLIAAQPGPLDPVSWDASRAPRPGGIP